MPAMVRDQGDQKYGGPLRCTSGTREHVILDVITQTACHAGHLDAARELIDGGRRFGPDGVRHEVSG